MRSESNAIWTSGEPVSLAPRRNSATTPDFFSVARDIRFDSSNVNNCLYFAGANSTEKVPQSIGLPFVRQQQSPRLQPAARQDLDYPHEPAVGGIDPCPTPRVDDGAVSHRLAVPDRLRLALAQADVGERL